MFQIHMTFYVHPESFVHLAVLPFSGAVFSHVSCVHCLAFSVEVEPMLCFILEGLQSENKTTPPTPQQSAFSHTKGREGGGRIRIFAILVPAEHQKHTVPKLRTF